jgi:hypothetical protein
VFESKGFQMPATKQFWLNPPFGNEDGYSTETDVLVNTSADGVDLNTIWADIQAALTAWNAERGAIVNLLSYTTTNTADAVPQGTLNASFEVATEAGEPVSHRAPTSHLLLGYDFEDYDFRTAFTWKFLRKATREQILAQANNALAADQKLVQGTVLDRIFDPAAGENEWGHTVYGLYNNDAIVPPAYLGKRFNGPHNHYLVSQGATIDSGDVEQAAKLVREHGYGSEANSQLVAFVNPEQLDVVSTFKAGVENNNDAIAHHDWIPSAGAPAYLQPENIMGQIAPATFNGLKIQGSYGDVWFVSSDFVPEDYLLVAATYGPNSQNNVVGIRQHQNPAYRNLRQIPGFVSAYPLQDSYFQRSFGVGVRHRGAAAVVQIKEAGNYDVPEIAR